MLRPGAPAMPTTPSQAFIDVPGGDANRKSQKALLLDLHTRGADESRGHVGGTARPWDHLETLDELLTRYDNAANTTDPEDNWLSVLQQACVDGHDDCVKLLVQRGADVNYISKNGLTAAAYAAKYGHVACLMELKAAGADMDLRGASDVSLAPLACAALNGKDKCVQFLIACGANVVEDDYRYNSLLLCAKQKGNHRCAELLLQKEPSLAKITDAHGNSALILAARRGDLELVRAIVDAVTTMDGPDLSVVNHANDGGDNALRLAKMVGSRGQGPSVVAFLLEKGAKEGAMGSLVVSEFEFVDESEWDEIEAELGSMMERVRSLNDRVTKALSQRDQRRGTIGGGPGRPSIYGATAGIGGVGPNGRLSLSIGRQSISVPGSTPSSRGSVSVPSPATHTPRLSISQHRPSIAGQPRASISVSNSPGHRASVSMGTSPNPRASLSFGGLPSQTSRFPLSETVEEEASSPRASISYQPRPSVALGTGSQSRRVSQQR